MTDGATHADALTVLRKQTPPTIAAFVEHLAADPAMRLDVAAQAIGKPGTGVEIMRDPRAARYLAAVLGSDRDALQDTRRKAIQMLSVLCGYDPAGAFDKATGLVLPIHSMPMEVRACIESYEIRADGTTRIRFVKRLEALKLLFAHFADVDNRALAVAGMAHVHFHGRDPL